MIFSCYCVCVLQIKKPSYRRYSKFQRPKKRMQGAVPPSILRIKKTLRHSCHRNAIAAGSSILILHKTDTTKNGSKGSNLCAALPLKKEKGGIGMNKRRGICVHQKGKGGGQSNLNIHYVAKKTAMAKSFTPYAPLQYDNYLTAEMTILLQRYLLHRILVRAYSIQ